MPKLSHEFVEAQFKKEGYQLLEQYKYAKDPVSCACPKGHVFPVSWNNFSSKGSRCPHCAGKIITYEQVKAAFEKEGYQLLSNEYKNAHQRLDFICPNGHNYGMKWNSFQQGQRCAYCTRGVVTHEQVQSAFSAEGYRLLSQYINSHSKMDFVCNNGHKHSICWANFNLLKQRCAHCAGQVLTHEQVKAAFEAEGYQLLSQYKNSGSKLKFICNNGHTHSICWESFKTGSRCAYCVKKGYDPNKPGRLYYVRFDFPGMQPLYKVGITNLRIRDRLKYDMKYCTVIMDKYYDDGSLPPQEERKILTRFTEWKYKGMPLLREGGDTELFTRDVLMLDTQRLLVS